jgi:small subunit ribosomal protein S20
MPVTTTAKRALRSSKRKKLVNDKSVSRLEILMRAARKKGDTKSVREAISQVDKVSKKKIIHKNKASRIKSRLSKLLSGNKKGGKKIIKEKIVKTKK